ncbi:chromate efflux transporter [Litorivicinus sp.]|nr:chromate efflux transporter [Litorivicinus sp.]
MKSSPLAIFLQFLWLGCTSFGGPIAHIGIFRQQFVEKEQRISGSDYALLVALCQMIPGPASSQIGMGLGYRFAGWRGASAAWLGFTLPSAALMLCAGLWILNGGGTNAGAWFITAMKLVAVGIVTQAVLGMWKQLCVDREAKIIALITAIAFYSVPTALMQVSLIAIALVAGYMFASNSDTKRTQPIGVQRNHLLASTVIGVVWLSGIVAALSITDGHVWAELIAGNYISGALVFGGGHVVLPLLESEFVPPMDSSVFLAGYGFAQAMPGPLFTIASYLGAVMMTESPFVAAMVGVFVIFIPGAMLLSIALVLGDRLTHWKSRLVFVNATVVGLLFAILINPVFTEAVYSEATTGLAVLSLLICVVLKRSPLELVGVMVIATYLCHLLEWF